MRQREDVEADVVVEDRVGHPERRLAVEQKDGLPLRRGGETGERRHQQGEDETADRHVAPEGVAARLKELTVGAGAIPRRHAPGDLDIDADDHEEDDERRDPGDDLPEDARPEHRAVVNLAEPEPVGVDTEEPARHRQDDQDSCDDDRSDDAASRTSGRRLRRRLAWAQGADVVHAG